MKALILAAGRGERMRPLTDHTPKPLLPVGGKPLIVWHIERLRERGFGEIVINVAHLGGQIIDHLGDGREFGVSIRYSDEREEGALETAGGIVKSLPLLGNDPFLVVNGDVWCDYSFDSGFELGNDLAHLLLVPNPPQHPGGDFALDGYRVLLEGAARYTYSGIGYYSPEMFSGLSYGARPLAPLLRECIAKDRVGGSLYPGEWRDIGTPQRLEELERELDIGRP